MCPLLHQWSAAYPGEYSTRRTRIDPNERVRQVASPLVPGCSVGAIDDQSVTSKGIASSFIGLQLLFDDLLRLDPPPLARRLLDLLGRHPVIHVRVTALPAAPALGFALH